MDSLNFKNSHLKKVPTVAFIRVPPRVIQQQTKFNISVRVKLNNKSDLAGDAAQFFAVNVSLRAMIGAGSVNKLGGDLTSSLQMHPSNNLEEDVLFRDLVIRQCGQYQLRIFLVAASYNGVFVENYVDSDTIHVSHLGRMPAANYCNYF